MFEKGFISDAPLFMDVVSIYFTLLPFLLFFAIRFAMKKNYKAHMISQISVFALTMVMVVIFEIGVRFIGGFSEFLKLSSVSENFFLIYLALHVIIALISVVSWILMLIMGYSNYKDGGFESSYFQKHKIRAKFLFLGLTLTAYSGSGIYYMLFLYK
jgi:putative membrane protein